MRMVISGHVIRNGKNLNKDCERKRRARRGMKKNLVKSCIYRLFTKDIQVHTNNLGNNENRSQDYQVCELISKTFWVCSRCTQAFPVMLKSLKNSAVAICLLINTNKTALKRLR